MKPKTSASLLVAFAIVASHATVSMPVSAKDWTINERQDQLMKDINAAQKRKDLTDKEAKKLRSDLADVARKEAKMKEKGNSTVSAVDNAKLENMLNNVSVKIKSLSLEKRVDQAKKEGAAEKEAEKKAKSEAKSSSK